MVLSRDHFPHDSNVAAIQNYRDKIPLTWRLSAQALRDNAHFELLITAHALEFSKMDCILGLV